MTAASEAGITSQWAGRSRRAWLLAFLLSLATALAIISPFAWKGNASGHDFSFHAASWVDAAAQWRSGIVLPRWADGANHGFGEPRFIFYPPVSWMFGAALGLVLPWIYVPAVFIVLTQTLAGLFAFALGRRLFSQRGALLCAFCYVANPYALLIVYMRSDFAEQLALVFFPLIMLAAFELLGFLPAAPRTMSRSMGLLALVFAAVWLTNAPAGVVASYTLAALFAYTAITVRSWRPLLSGGAALALGLGLAGFYLVPASYEQRWVNISQALASGLQPAQNFLYAVIEDQEHNAFNRIASSAALLMILMTGLAAATSGTRRGQSEPAAWSKPVWKALLIVAAVAAFPMLRISNVFWVVLPKLRFVQFPWRWMSILAIPFTCFIAAAIAQPRVRGRRMAVTLAVLVAILAGTATFMCYKTWWDSEDIPVLLEAVQNDEGFEGVDEYDPAGDEHASLPEKFPKAKILPSVDDSEAAPHDATIQVQPWSAEKKELRVTAREPVRLELRLLNYPAWRVEVNDAAVEPQAATGETNPVIVPLAAGSSHVVVRLVRTGDRTAGAVLSCVSATLWLFLLVGGRKTISSAAVSADPR
jgi:hypothetical protein